MKGMKMKQTIGTKRNTNGNAFTAACLAQCQKMLAQIKAVKNAILDESSETLAAQKHVLELALNEAEALAWQTMYPHLIFPTLALEKAQAVSAWNKHQQFVRRGEHISALAA
jgi:hypothetical protein